MTFRDTDTRPSHQCSRKEYQGVPKVPTNPIAKAFFDCKRAGKAVAQAHFHDMGKWDQYDVCECLNCGAALAAWDCQIFVGHNDFAILGTLGRDCEKAEHKGRASATSETML